MRQIPDISGYRLHRTVHDIDLEGVVIPGLTGQFYEREEGGRMATAGRYSLAGEEIFMAWGYRDEAHCAWTAYRQREGWTTPHRGCPRIRVENATIARPGDGGVITGPGAPGLQSAGLQPYHGGRV